MPKVAAFHSIYEGKKLVLNRVHHDNSACAAGRDIPQNERRTGTGGYRLCENCTKETNSGH